MKQCSKCMVEKSFLEFYENKAKPGSYFNHCKQCKKESVTEYRKKNLEVCRERERIYSQKNSERRNLKVKEFLKANPDAKKKYQLKYESKPEVKERMKEKGRAYAERRRKNDILFVLRANCRSRIWAALKSINSRKYSGTAKIVGCSIPILKSRIESMFTDGMSWGNYGEWHIDHIVPISSGKSESEIINLCHYSNLQPLWASENLKKGARLDYSPDKISS